VTVSLVAGLGGRSNGELGQTRSAPSRSARPLQPMTRVRRHCR